MRFFLAILLYVYASLVVYPQDCRASLSGQVMDFHDQTPLVGATVLVVQQNKAVLTDLEGNFRIENLCEGVYEVELSHPQCRTLFFEVTIEGDLRRDFEMEHHLEELEEV